MAIWMWLQLFISPMFPKNILNRLNAFTLVELLLGLAVAAIIGMAVYNMFWSSMKLDDKMRRVHETYMEVLMADQSMTHDLENAISLDFSDSYPDSRVFEGQKTEFTFLTQTPKGIKRVRYYSGFLDRWSMTKRMIGRVVNPSNTDAYYSNESSPVEFLVRQESSLADWLNETGTNTTSQVVAAGLKKGTFQCQYAPFVKDLHTSGPKGIVYSDSWEAKELPMGVCCHFVLYDPKKPQAGTVFKRNIFLSPVVMNGGNE